MKKIFVSILFALAAIALPAKNVIRTAIIEGQDLNHWTAGAAAVLEQILENTGGFDVEILHLPGYDEDIALFNPDFSKYDLVIMQCGGKTWSEPVRKNFEKYVADGGGVVINHSSIIPMADWPAYNEMAGLGAWDGRDGKWGPYLYIEDGEYVYDYTPGWAGHHGLQHHTVITNHASEHPVLAELPAKWHHYKDEIYTKLRGPAKNIEILSTVNENGNDEPVMWTVRYGKGRVFVDVLGHCGSDPNMIYAVTCTGYQVTFIRGCQWAATGTVTLPVPSDFPTETRYSLRPDFKAPFHAYPAK